MVCLCVLVLLFIVVFRMLFLLLSSLKLLSLVICCAYNFNEAEPPLGYNDDVFVISYTCLL